MHPNFIELFFMCFLGFACLYGMLASWTSVFYRKKAVGRLHRDEIRIKQGTADLDNRLRVMTRTFFLSFLTYQVYLLALVLSSLLYFFIGSN